MDNKSNFIINCSGMNGRDIAQFINFIYNNTHYKYGYINMDMHDTTTLSFTCVLENKKRITQKNKQWLEGFIYGYFSGANISLYMFSWN